MCASFLTQSYQLPVLDTMFVRKKYRGKDFGLHMLEDFVDSFTEDALGLRYPLSFFLCTGKGTKLKMLSCLNVTSSFQLVSQNSINLCVSVVRKFGIWALLRNNFVNVPVSHMYALEYTVAFKTKQSNFKNPKI